MRTPEYSTQFQRDVKRVAKRGKDMSKLKEVLSLLIAESPLLPRHKDHALKGEWLGFRDAHVRARLDSDLQSAQGLREI